MGVNILYFPELCMDETIAIGACERAVNAINSQVKKEWRGKKN